MTRYEMKKKKTSLKRKMILSLSLIAVGLALVITAAIMEASHYPWGILFGTATQNADVIPDPLPIVLDPEDQEIDVTAEAPITASSSTDVEVTDAEATPSASAALPGDVEDAEKAPVAQFVVLGTLKIPVLSVSQNLLEGAGKQMKYGVGHLPSTAAPGQKGNCAISGHRPYPFRYLDQLKAGDHIVIKSGGIVYTYAVFESFDVLPTDVWVLNNIPGEDYALTLITCTPYMVSSHRLIVRARLLDIDGKTPQDYYGVASPEVTPTDSSAPESTDVSADVSAEVSATDTSPAITTDAPVNTTESPAITTESPVDTTDVPAETPTPETAESVPFIPD